MIQGISNLLSRSRWVGYVLLFMLAVPFTLWGVNSYFVGGSSDEDAIATVNGVALSRTEFLGAYQRRLATAAQQFGGTVPPLLEDNMRSQIFDSLVRRTLLEQLIEEADYAVADSLVAEAIAERPEFQDEQGDFDVGLYRSLLSSNGLSTTVFEDRVRRELLSQQFYRAIADSAFVLSTEYTRQQRLQNEERQLRYIRVAVAEQEIETADDATIAEHYDKHIARYRTPERLKLAYIEINEALLAAELRIDEQQLRDEFLHRQDEFVTPPQRHAAHILLSVAEDAEDAEVAAQQQRAEALQERLEQGEDFAELARENSEDPGSAEQGGDLGKVRRGMMVQPFEQALFALAEGEVSAPVRSGFGFHLIKLLAVEEEKREDFDAVRPALEEEMRQQSLDRLFFERSDILAQQAYENPFDMDWAEDALGSAAQRSEWLTRSGQPNGLWSNEALLDAAFSDAVLKDKQNSAVLEIGPLQMVVLRVAEHDAGTPKPLDMVREEIRDTLHKERRQQSAKQQAEALLAKVEGKSWEQAETVVNDVDSASKEQDADASEDQDVAAASADASKDEDSDAPAAASADASKDEDSDAPAAASADANKDLDAVADGVVAWSPLQWYKRDSQEPEAIVISKLFLRPRPVADKPDYFLVESALAYFVVAVLDWREPTEIKPYDAQSRQQERQLHGQQEYQQWLKQLQQRADIRRLDEAL